MYFFNMSRTGNTKISRILFRHERKEHNIIYKQILGRKLSSNIEQGKIPYKIQKITILRAMREDKIF